ncbi:MAG TPA: tetratricopeptide repeat protein [Polyangia bacterium]|nr:tetratricopeptide repeat protein [Polyangia bacterium]
MTADGLPGALAAELPLAPGPSSLVAIDTAADWILMRGGRVLFRHDDPARYLARVIWLRVRSGGGPLELRVAASAGRVELSAAVLPAERAPARIEELPAPEPPLAGVDGVLVRALLLLHRGDPNAADGLLAQSHDAHGLLLRAYAAAVDPSRAGGTARERARSLLEQALAADPGALRATYNLALLDLQDDRAREALARLEGSRPPPGLWSWHSLRAQALRARGLSEAADRVLAEVAQSAPDACGLLPQLASAARERQDLSAERRLSERQRACDAESQALADLCATQGDSACAAAEYARLLEADPTRDALRLPLADALLARGQAHEAARVLAVLVEHEPRQAHYRQRLADALYEAEGAPAARRALEQATRALPESADLWRALESLGAAGPLEPFRVDGRAVIAAYGARPQPSDHNANAPAVVLLDRTVTRAFSSGARLTLTHNIIRVQTKAGIDRWGEVQIPAGADVLTLRTVKADGSVREPEEIAEKESVSVPDLLPGDFVEFEYIEPAAPPAAFSNGFLAERFYFSSFEAPLDRTEYVLATPQGMPVDVDARGGMGTTEQRARMGAMDVRTWARTRQVELVQEPGAAPYVEILPSVRASSGVTFARWSDYLRETLASSFRANTELREVAEKTCAHVAARACAAALAVWVGDNVEHSGTLPDSASATLARRQGNRTGLLAALLHAAGQKPEIWLVRPVVADATAPVVQEIDDFDQPTVRTEGSFLDPRTRRLEPFFLPPTLRGARALRLSAGGPLLTSPGGAANADSRTVVLEGRIEPQKPIHLKVRELLSGWPAVEWREALDHVDPSRLRQDFEQRSLGFFFPGAQLLSLEFERREAGRGPLAIRYQFAAPRLVRAAGARRLTMGALLPSLLARRYVALPTRTTALALGYLAPTTVRATLALPAGARVLAPPESKLSSRFGRFAQRVRIQGGTLQLERELELPLQRIAPEDYARFVAFARAVDEAEQADITIDLP